MTDTENKKVTETVVESNKPEGNTAKEYFAITSLIVGILSLCTSIIGCGCLLSIIGIIFGALGASSSKYKTMAIVGIVTSILGFILSICLSMFGAGLTLLPFFSYTGSY